MSGFAAITRERHGSKRWLRPQGYGFAAKDATVPIVGTEVNQLLLSMPIGFVRQGDRFQLSALLSLTPGINMFINQDGSWAAGSIPAVIRSYPFRMLLPEGATDPVLCIDEDSGMVCEDTVTGEEFFAADGSVSSALQAVLKFQADLEAARKGMETAVTCLDQAGLIKPWPIRLRTENGEDRTIVGIYRIDEETLNVLPGDAFARLRASGALTIAFGQLFSMGRLSVFKSLADLRTRLAPKPVAPLPETLDHLFQLEASDKIRFD